MARAKHDGCIRAFNDCSKRTIKQDRSFRYSKQGPAFIHTDCSEHLTVGWRQSSPKGGNLQRYGSEIWKRVESTQKVQTEFYENTSDFLLNNVFIACFLHYILFKALRAHYLLAKTVLQADFSSQGGNGPHLSPYPSKSATSKQTTYIY